MNGLTEAPIIFRDRHDGGRRLVSKLERYHAQAATVVIGLPRGGVVTAAEVAAGLELPLDIIISRKIGAPNDPELAIGAIAEGGEPYLNEYGLSLAASGRVYLDTEIARQRAEIVRRRQLFRNGKALVLPAHATVILVDDGVATGATAIAAIHALRAEKLRRLVVAVPVAAPDTALLLRQMVDELVTLSTPAMFGAVGSFYDEFEQVTDEEVGRLLECAHRAGNTSSR